MTSMLCRRIWSNLITHRASQPARCIAPFVSRLQAINQLVSQSGDQSNHSFSSSAAQPRRPKHKNRAKIARRRQREDMNVTNNEFDDDFDNHNEDQSDYGSSYQSENLYDDNIEQDDEDDFDDRAVNRSLNQNSGLDAHIARVRKWRTDTRDLHSFLRVVNDDTIIPIMLSQRIDWVAVDNEFQSGWNDRYEKTNAPLYYLANHAAMRYAVIHRVMNETLKLAPMLSINQSINVLDASFRVGAAAWAISQSVSQSNSRSLNPSKARIASYSAIEPNLSYHKIGRQLTQHLPMDIDIFQNLPSFERMIESPTTHLNDQPVPVTTTTPSESLNPPPADESADQSTEKSSSQSVNKPSKPDIVMFAYGLLDLGPNESKVLLDRLWKLVPESGVLILIEKGSKEGWEVIRDARHRLLKHNRTPVVKQLTDDSVDQSSDVSINHSIKQTSDPPLNELNLPILSIPPNQAPSVLPSHMTVLAPCAHDVQCPQGPKSRCIFGNRTLTSSLPGTTPVKQIKSAEELGGLVIDAFAYVVLHKGPVTVPVKVKPSVDELKAGETPNLQSNHQSNADIQLLYPFARHRYHRLTRPSLVRQGHTLLDMCTTDGKLERRLVPKKLGLDGGYVQAKDTRWGDRWQFDRVVTKTQLRKQRSEANKAKLAKETVVDAEIVTNEQTPVPIAKTQSSKKVKKHSTEELSEKEIMLGRVNRELAKLKPGDSLESLFAAQDAADKSAVAARAAKRKSSRPSTAQDQSAAGAEPEDDKIEVHDNFPDDEVLDEAEFEEFDRETAKKAKKAKQLKANRR